MTTTTRAKLGNPAAVAVAASKAVPVAKEGINKVNNDTKGALSWVVVGGAVILGAIVLKTIHNASKVGNVVGGIADVASSTLDEVVSVIKDPNLNASNSPIGNAGEVQITITEVEAQAKANLLLDALNFPGSNENRVVEALSNITIADYVLIAEKFGTPRYNELLGVGAYWPYPKRNLSYWIAAELDDNELNQIRAILPGLF